MSSKGGKKGGSADSCTIYDDIDNLSDCCALPEGKRFPTFVAALQKILNKMAYYVQSSDGAVLEHTEHWHETFTDRLYEATGKARTEAVAQRAHAPAAAPGGAAAAASERPLPPPVPTRKAPDNIPASLRAIMQGTHESLNESDDDA